MSICSFAHPCSSVRFSLESIVRLALTRQLFARLSCVAAIGEQTHTHSHAVITQKEFLHHTTRVHEQWARGDRVVPEPLTLSYVFVLRDHLFCKSRAWNIHAAEPRHAGFSPDSALAAFSPHLKVRQPISGYLLPLGPLVRERNASW